MVNSTMVIGSRLLTLRALSMVVAMGTELATLTKLPRKLRTASYMLICTRVLEIHLSDILDTDTIHISY